MGSSIWERVNGALGVWKCAVFYSVQGSCGSSLTTAVQAGKNRRTPLSEAESGARQWFIKLSARRCQKHVFDARVRDDIIIMRLYGMSARLFRLRWNMYTTIESTVGKA